MVTKSDERIELEAFNEAFFASLAQRGIRCFDSLLSYKKGRRLETDVASALAYVFTESMTDVSPGLRGITYKNEKEFLRLLIKKAGDLDSRQRIDIKATFDRLTMDRIGFEKYEMGEGKWFVNDLGNVMKLEIETGTDDFSVFIHVYSST